MFVQSDLWICVDCIQLIANGDSPPDWTDEQVEQWQANIEINWPDQSNICAGDSDLREEFGVLPCEFCGDSLAGERHHCVELREEKEEENGN